MRSGGAEGAVSPRIVYVGRTPPHPGGAGMWAGQLLRGLAGLGFDLHALTATVPGQPPVLPDGIGVTTFPVPYRAVNPDNWGLGYRRGLAQEIGLRLPRLLDTFEPDLLVVGSESLLSPVAAAVRAREVPLLLVVHGIALQLQLPGFPLDVAQEFLAALPRPQEIIVVGHHMIKPLRAVRACPLTAIPNSVDVARFAPRPASAAMLERWAIPADAVVVGHFSNFKPIKRLPDLVAAVGNALRRDRRLILLFVGNGPDWQAIRDLCRQSGIMDRCRFTGWVPHEQVPELLALCQIVAMPSQSEAMALAYLEAQSAERVLIASDIPAAREVIIEGRTGLLHPPGEVRALADRILAAAADSELRCRLGRQAREYVMHNHKVSHMIARYAEIIDSMIPTGKRRRVA